MFRPLPFIAVRQQADEAGHAQPFALARRDELVEDDLRAIGEIAELRLPQSERVGLGKRIAVFEAEHGLFGKHRVDHFEFRLLSAEVVERLVASLRLLVEEHRMALREGAALHVLTAEPNLEAFLEERAESERL